MLTPKTITAQSETHSRVFNVLSVVEQNVCFCNPFNQPNNQPLVDFLFKQCRIREWKQSFSDNTQIYRIYTAIKDNIQNNLQQKFAQQFMVFW